MLTCPVVKKVSPPSAKLACFHLVRRLFPRVSRGPNLSRHFTASAPSLHFKRYVSQKNWQHQLHYERTKALPDEWVIRAPRSESRKYHLRDSENNYVLYNPASYRLGGLEFPPVSETGIAPMKFYYQILTTPTADTPGTTVLLHFPDKRYFLGQVSEGTQRACTERGVKLTYLTDVFLTGRMEWANTGGLIGTILTQADGVNSSAQALEEAERHQKPHRGGQTTESRKHGAAYAMNNGQMVAQRGTLTVHGGRNLSHTLATARRFVFRQGMPVFMKEYDSETLDGRESAGAEDPFAAPTWSDNNIKVWAMPVKPSSLSSSQESAGGAAQPGQQSPRKRSLDEFQEDSENLASDAGAGDDGLDRRTREQIMRQSVVTDMFNSSWRMDALVETPLAQVNMPAAIFIRNPENKRIEKYTGPAPGSGEPLPDIKVLVRQPWPGATVEKLPPTTRSDEALSYVVRNHDIRGKFDPKKAIEHKVRKGPDFSRLTKGESVVSEDGTTITPEMVLGPPRLGKGFAIIDLPAPEYVDNLINRAEWNSPAVTAGLEAFLWILGPGVGDHPGLRDFVAKVPHCKHMVSSTDYCPNYLALASVAESSVRLARVKGDSYSVPVHDNVTLPQPGTTTENSPITKQMVQNSPFEPAEPGLLINMEPKFELNREEVVRRLNPAETIKNMPRAVEKRLDTIRKRMAKSSFKDSLEQYRQGLLGQDVEITALGTGSSSPSKYRNVSGTLVKVPGIGYYILDCGENTLGQLRRVFEPEQLREILRSLRMIWISHLHADHHLGTASLIRAWKEENYPDGAPQTSPYIEDDLAKLLDEKRLFVVSEDMMIGWLEEYAAVEDYGFGKVIPLAANPYIDQTNEGLRVQTMFSHRHCRGDGSYPGFKNDVGKPSTTYFKFNETSALVSKLRAATGLADLRATRVPHCRGAMAVSLVFPDGFQLSYSGDCRPSKSFCEIGRGSTVLIHEATFQDDMQGSAIAKRHSTVSEALEVGRQMGARTILLTHFSQRYQKVAYVDQHTGKVRESDDAVPVSTTETQDNKNDGPTEEPEGLQDNTDPDADISTAISFKDQIKLRLASRRGSRPSVPTTAVFDYMRIRVGDVPIAQEYTPALEKLFDMLERVSAEGANEARRERQKIEAEHAEKKGRGKKHTAPVAATTTTAAEKEEVNGRSAWSASESESGWSTSEPESEGER